MAERWSLRASRRSVFSILVRQRSNTYGFPTRYCWFAARWWQCGGEPLAALPRFAVFPGPG